jgi:diguanylate cyclase (GGDEF)-like protein
MAPNRVLYIIGLVYFVVVTCLFIYVFRKNSFIAQLIIYLSISVLFLFSGFITQNRPDIPATMFVVMLLISPLFMIDKPYFMGIELFAASVIFLIWMHGIKPEEVWKIDLANIVIFGIVGFFLHVIANSIRIREFVLTREINIQKDTDDLTGLKNKSAITREINEFLADETKTKGLMLLLDIDHFKEINDTFGHDVGDGVISQLGAYLKNNFSKNEIAGRFGGDEFIVFIKDTDDTDFAEKTARGIVDGAADFVELPDREQKMSVSVGIAVYHGMEKNYSEIFKKADLALYKTKSDRTLHVSVYDEADDNA